MFQTAAKRTEESVPHFWREFSPRVGLESTGSRDQESHWYHFLAIILMRAKRSYGNRKHYNPEQIGLLQARYLEAVEQHWDFIAFSPENTQEDYSTHSDAVILYGNFPIETDLETISCWEKKKIGAQIMWRAMCSKST